LNVGLQAGILLDDYRMFNNKNHSTRFDKLGILQSGHFLVIPESSAFRRAIIKGKGLLLTPSDPWRFYCKAVGAACCNVRLKLF